MSNPINGPGDVKIGDVVECDVGDDRRSKRVTGTVKRTTPTTMTIETVTGETIRKPFMVTKIHRQWSGARRYKVARFRLVSDRELWWHNAPTKSIGGVSATCGAGLTCPTVVFMSANIRDTPDEVKRQIDVLSAWLKDEPK